MESSPLEIAIINFHNSVSRNIILCTVVQADSNVDCEMLKREISVFDTYLPSGIRQYRSEFSACQIETINGIEFKEINTSEGDLEDVFIKVVSKNDTSV